MAQRLETFDYRMPDPELERGVDPRLPDPPSSRLTPMPADKILFPRRMLYVEALLYLLIAAASFGLGYLIGRNGHLKPAIQDGANNGGQQVVPVEGSVTWVPLRGKEQPEAGDVVILLPDGKTLDKPIPIAGLRPEEPEPDKNSPTVRSLIAAGGVLTRTNEKGHFQLVAPQPGKYNVLILSQQVNRELAGQEQMKDRKDLERYFDLPGDLLKNKLYKWFPKKVDAGMDKIETTFHE